MIALIAIFGIGGCNTEPVATVSVEPEQEQAKQVEPPKEEQREPPTIAEQLIGKWRLVASSEDPSTTTGIPSFIEWETVEFRSNGHKYTTYKHTGSTETFTSDNTYEVIGALLTNHGTSTSFEQQVIIDGKGLELRTDVSFQKYER